MHGWHQLVREYPIGVSLPPEPELLLKELPIPRETQLAAYWGRSWLSVYVLNDNDDGTIDVRWNDYSSS